MGDFLRVLLDSISYLWPLRIVRVYEQAALYRFGSYWKTVGEGMYIVVPFFMSIHEIVVVPGMIVGPRQDITLKDGTNLSYIVSAWYRVFDTNLAVNSVEDYAHTILELMEAVVADRLVKVKIERLDPENRADLLRDLTGWLDAESETFGVEISKVRFSSFILKSRTYRLLGETSAGIS